MRGLAVFQEPGSGAVGLFPQNAPIVTHKLNSNTDLRMIHCRETDMRIARARHRLRKSEADCPSLVRHTEAIALSPTDLMSPHDKK